MNCFGVIIEPKHLAEHIFSITNGESEPVILNEELL